METADFCARTKRFIRSFKCDPKPGKYAGDNLRERLERWRLDYNQARPHSALGDRSPEEFVREWKESSAASSRTAGPANQAPAGAVHCSDTADPKLTPLFVPPSDVKGGPEKLSPGSPKRQRERAR